ncbi:hypothetical protein ACIPMU_36240 [Streptomyces cyaneofuscatus]|uniref:hypothetical protein n=1 Tax=Streptomyces cyaneofuscatus TaxID=66883 RepID=UPI003804CC98
MVRFSTTADRVKIHDLQRNPWIPAFTHGDLQIAHVFVAGAARGNTSPTRRVARSVWATTTSASSLGKQVAEVSADVAGLIACDDTASRLPLPDNLVRDNDP